MLPKDSLPRCRALPLWLFSLSTRVRSRIVFGKELLKTKEKTSPPPPLTMSISSLKSVASSIDCSPDAGASVACRCDVGSVLPLGAPGRILPFCLLVRAAPTARLPPLERVPPLWRPIA